jgi:uncharacterized membrane-anchored protein YhcB (DUF1043 family)
VESIDPIWLFGGIVFAGGIFLGVLLLRLFNPKTGDVEKLQAELDQARKDMESYKADVNTHFNKTSDLVNELTQDYVKVYRHLAEGAQALSETREFTQVLDQPQGQVLISVQAEVEQPADPDPESVAAEAEQPSTAVDDAVSEGGDATSAEPTSAEPTSAEPTSAEPTSVADDTPDPPADYAKTDESVGTAKETAKETMSPEAESADTESVASTDKEDNANTAAASADEVKPDEAEIASTDDVEPPAVAAETGTDATRKT